MNVQATLIQDAKERNEKVYCEKCNQKLHIHENKIKFLELSITDGVYYDGIPEGHESQGWFPFGTACAKSILKNGGQF